MRKIIPVVAAGVAVLAIAGAGSGYAIANKDVTLAVDGVAKDVTTTAGTVEGVLSAEGIAVGERDVVAPALDARVTDGTRIAVQFARQVTVNVDGKPQTFWTTATNVEGALSTLGTLTQGAELSTSRSSAVGREGLTIDLATQKTVTLKADGKKRSFETTAATVSEALSAANITVDGDDLLSVDRNAALKDGASITYTRVDIKSVTKKETIGYETVRKNSARIARGRTVVDQAGRGGSRTVTYREVRYDGELKSRKVIDTKVTNKPSTRVILVGTKQPSSSSSSSSSSRSNAAPRSGGRAPAVASGGVWDRLAQCESGGNWSINTGNGYYGGLQFSLSTWRAYGGSGLPSNNSREQQIAIAKKLQAAAGWGQWPACTSKLGLR